ncbi:MAG: helix-turn-helix domain-containing protein [Sulfurimonas sp.]|nr:helix-turn-helix domain-containing protein [Sulfurimonas sp.]
MTLIELSNKIKSLRKEKKYSQDQLQAFSSITKRTISKIENGFVDEVGIKKVETILDLLGYEFSIRPKNRPKTLEELQDERK